VKDLSSFLDEQEQLFLEDIIAAVAERAGNMIKEMMNKGFSKSMMIILAASLVENLENSIKVYFRMEKMMHSLFIPLIATLGINDESDEDKSMSVNLDVFLRN